jgi:DNA-binding ferritin-like protein
MEEQIYNFNDFATCALPHLLLLRINAQHAHVYASGAGFVGLHELYQEIYEWLDSCYDEILELHTYPDRMGITYEQLRPEDIMREMRVSESINSMEGMGYIHLVKNALKDYIYLIEEFLNNCDCEVVLEGHKDIISSHSSTAMKFVYKLDRIYSSVS